MAEAGSVVDKRGTKVDNPEIQAGMSKPPELDNPEYPVYSSYTRNIEHRREPFGY
jgi:hypothetical protein